MKKESSIKVIGITTTLYLLNITLTASGWVRGHGHLWFILMMWKKEEKHILNF